VVNVVVGPVPVIVTLYPCVVVVLWVVTVAVAGPGATTDDGLMVHAGGLVAVCCPVTWQLKFTVTLGLVLLGNPTVIREEATPLGATASGLNGSAESVNSDVPCAAATDANRATTTAQIANRHTTLIALCPGINFILDSDDSDLNMNGF
jgi:hypothetical protein